jgi:outer membrane protein assembly factor BamD (BamD/ComL family)
VVDYKQPAFYLRNLPLTDSLISISNDRIATALLNAGNAYSEKIIDIPRATSTYESLISRFPSDDLVPEALYNLYKINKEENSIKAEAYRQRLLQNYPESEYAKILSDPEYYSKKMAELNMTEKLYTDAYTQYSEENFGTAIELCNDALIKFGENILAPKFTLLRAYSIARTSDERAFKEALTELIKKWPGSEESRRAESLIAYLNQEMPELKVEEDKVIAAELYIADTAAVHVFGIIISNPSFNVNQAAFDVISYNIDNYTNKNYRTEGTLVDNKYILITVSGFTDYSQTMDYFTAFKAEGTIRNPSASKITPFIISLENLNLQRRSRSPMRNFCAAAPSVVSPSRLTRQCLANSTCRMYDAGRTGACGSR